MTTMIEKFINQKKPFAVIKYNEWLKTDKSQSRQIYEIIYIEKRVCATGKMLYVTGKTLKEEALEVFKKNISLFKLVLNNQDGQVYEFNGFKNYHDAVFPSKEEVKSRGYNN